MTAFKLAYRNLIGSGLRTWLNVVVLSLVYILIIWFYGLLDGWNRQAKRDMINWETGTGQYWQKNYDPYDPFTLNDSHDKIPAEVKDDINKGLITPILISQASIYPEGRIQGALLKGIDPGQTILELPTEKLAKEMKQMQGEATIMVCGNNYTSETIDGWNFTGLDILLKEIEDIITTKSKGGSILYIFLMLLAMLAVFDTQVLSIFRRQREIGNNMAMGMTRGQVVRLFTIEGAMHAVLAALLGAVYGIPLLSLQAIKGFAIPGDSGSYGLAMADTIYPVYSIGFIFGTIIIVFITTTIFSYLPPRN